VKVSGFVVLNQIEIIGPGALGLYFGMRCQLAGCGVVFRHARKAARVDPDALTLKLHGGSVHRIEKPVFLQPGEEGPDPDLTIVAVKTTISAQDLSFSIGNPARHRSLFTIQNGLGNVERLQQLAPNVPVHAGLCQIGVARETPGEIVNFIPGDGFVQLGSAEEASGELDRIDELLQRAGLKIRRIPSLNEALWRKLMWNIPFNGLCVLRGGQTTDRVLADPPLRERSRQLMEETRLAGNALGESIEPEYVDRLIEFTERMEPYRPSSLADLEAGRPLELEAIFREPLRRGESAGVQMPELRRLMGELEQISPDA